MAEQEQQVETTEAVETTEQEPEVQPEPTEETEDQEQPEGDEPEEEPEESEEPEGDEEDKEEPPKSAIIDSVKEFFPDDEFESEEDAVNAVKARLESAADFEEKTRAKDKKLLDIINASPDFADLLFLMGQGASYEEAHSFVMGESDIDLDQAKDGWKKSASERKKAAAEHEKTLKKTQQNWKDSRKTIETFRKEKGMSEKQSTGMFGKIDEYMLNLVNGTITPEMLEVYYKGLNYDNAVKEEKEKSEVMGRNEAIKEMKTKKQATKGDGLPHPNSAAPKSDDPKADTPESRLIRGMKAWRRPFD